MTWNRVRKGLLTMALLTIAAVSALAQDSALAKRVDVDLKDADLEVAVAFLRKQTGLQFVITPGTEAFKPITLSLVGRRAEEAIRYICEAAGAWAEQDENGVFIIRRGTRPADARVDGKSGATVKRVVKTEKIRVMKADPVEIYKMLSTGYMFDPIQGFRELNMMQDSLRRDTWSKVGSYVLDGGPSNTYPVTSGFQPTFGPEPKVGPTSTGSNDITLPGTDSANQGRPGGGGGGGAGFGGPGAGGAGGAGAGGNGGGALQGGTGFVPEGIERVSYDPTDNTIIVQGDDEAINKLRNLISLFDQAPKQVIIKVEFITVSQSFAKTFGMDWLYQRGAISAGNTPGSFARAGDPIFINYATGNITTRLRTFLTEGNGKTVNAPLLRTLNNQFASVQQNISTTVFLPQTQNGAGGIQTIFVPQSIQVSTGLAVRPRINGDGTVTMTLQPFIGDLGQTRRGPDGAEVPDTLSQTLNVVARVKSGETIALGGLTRKQSNTTVIRFPVLSELPIIGQLFRSTSTQRNDSELIVFVTPIIIEDESIGGFTP